MEEMDWGIVWFHFYHMAIAYALALPIAFDREADSPGAGLRTFPLVAVASCGYMLVGIDVLSSTDAEARVIYGLMTGIGFIGGGAILKSKGEVHGTSTAASIWNTGAIGMAVAWNRFEIAVVLAAINFATLRFAPVIKHRIDNGKKSRSGD